MPQSRLVVIDVDGSQFILPWTLLIRECPAFKNFPCTNNTRVSIEGVKSETFLAIEQRIRTGQEPTLTVQNVVDIYCAAFAFRMKRLARHCLKNIFESSKIDQALIYYVDCIKRKRPKEAQHVAVYLADNFAKLHISSKRIVELTEQQLSRLLNERVILETPEADRLSVVLQWIHHDCETRCDSCMKLLRNFNLSFFDIDLCPIVAKRLRQTKRFDVAKTKTIKRSKRLSRFENRHEEWTTSNYETLSD